MTGAPEPSAVIVEGAVDSFARSRRPVVMVDFDGTISEIVERPDQARPVPGAVGALSALAQAGVRTVVLSSRPVSFLAPVLEGRHPSIHLVGHSGFESLLDGRHEVDDAVKDWIPVVERTRAEAAGAVPDTTVIEDKGLSFALHYRAHPERADAVRAVAEELARSSGLAIKDGRMTVELRPPVRIDKGSMVRRLLDGSDHDWALVAGDDLVDVSAFEAVGAAPVTGVRIAIGSAELPPALAAAADVVLERPERLVDVLRALADRRDPDSIQ